MSTMVFPHFFILLMFAACTRQPTDTPVVVLSDIVLKDTALKDINARILIGSPIEPSNNNARYLNIFKTELNAGQGLWFARWGGWESAESFSFSELNSRINWLKDNGLSTHVHMLVGPDMYMPDWLINGTWRQTELDSMLQNMIRSVMETNDNKNKVDIWNVANELFEDDGTYRKAMVWNQLGMETDSSGLTNNEKINDQHPLFIRKVFTYCREKTTKKLELRDFLIENNNPWSGNDKRHKAFYQLLKHMLNTHIPIDVVGIQGHLQVGNTDWLLKNDGVKTIVQKYKALGLEVYITELDVETGKQEWTPQLAEQQKQDYYNYIKQAIEGGVSRIYFWGVQDGLDKGWFPDGHPLPWDENLERKRAYFGAKQVLRDTK